MRGIQVIMRFGKQELFIVLIICTKNRLDDLKSKSLYSLQNVRYNNFEVIVLDASDNNRVSDHLKKNSYEYKTTYVKAKKAGLASQRNESLKYLKSNYGDEIDIVLFCDDDIVFYENNLKSLNELFKNAEINSGAIILKDKKIRTKSNFNLKYRVTNMFNIIFNNIHYSTMRKVLKSGAITFDLYNKNLYAEWLNGGFMAYRYELIKNRKFNEELQLYGGHAYGEDVEFSYKFHRKYGYHHIIIDDVVEHIPSEIDSRCGSYDFNKLIAYNRKVLFKELSSSGHQMFYIYWLFVGLFIKAIILSIKEKNLDILKGLYHGAKIKTK